MLLSNPKNNFTFFANWNFATESLFGGDSGSGTENFFLLLNGPPFLLLNNTNFLLLQPATV